MKFTTPGNKVAKLFFSPQNQHATPKTIFFFVCIVCLFFIQAVQGETPGDDSQQELLNKFIASKGPGIISFDASNIKQFWIDKSVISRSSFFEILLNKNTNESLPFNLQLINVSEEQDCKIEVITTNQDLSFKVIGKKSKVISESQEKTSFLHYTIVSSTFHLYDVTDYSFSVQFSATEKDIISCQGVILSFPKNNLFKQSPGVLKLDADSFSPSNSYKVTEKSNDFFEVSGNRTTLLSKNQIQVNDNTLKYSVTLKNTGIVAAEIYGGYAPFAKGGRQIGNSNMPYKEKNPILKIESVDYEANKIIVNQYPEWEKGCFVALDAKEDLSDFPNFNLINGKISDVTKIDEEHTAITFDKPFNTTIKVGTMIRIQAKEGASYIYKIRYNLAPGEEKTFTGEMKKEDDYFKYSAKAFCKNTFYVMPILLFYSSDQNGKVNANAGDHTIQISDFSISY